MNQTDLIKADNRKRTITLIVVGILGLFLGLSSVSLFGALGIVWFFYWQEESILKYCICLILFILLIVVLSVFEMGGGWFLR